MNQDASNYLSNARVDYSRRDLRKTSKSSGAKQEPRFDNKLKTRKEATERKRLRIKEKRTADIKEKKEHSQSRRRKKAIETNKRNVSSEDKKVKGIVLSDKTTDSRMRTVLNKNLKLK